MEGYILIVLQILITGLIIWRRKQNSKEPLGCLAAGFIFMIVFALTTVLFSHRPSPQILQTDMENTGSNTAASHCGIGNIGCGIGVCLYYLHEVCLTHV